MSGEFLAWHHDDINQPVGFLNRQIVEHEMPRLVKVGRQANDVVFVLASPTAGADVVLVVSRHFYLPAFCPPCRSFLAAASVETSLEVGLVCMRPAFRAASRRGCFRPTLTTWCSLRTNIVHIRLPSRGSCRHRGDR